MANPEKFDWNEFLKPNTEKFFFFVAMLVIALIVVVFVILRATVASAGGAITEQFSDIARGFVTLVLVISLLVILLPTVLIVIFGAMSRPFGEFGYPDFWIFLITVIQLAYLYLLSCFLYKFGKDNRKIRAAIIGWLILAFIAVFIMVSISQPRPHYSGPDQNMCKVQLASSSACYFNNGTWNSAGCGAVGCYYMDQGFNQQCLNATTGPLVGTPWYKDSTHFNCGPRPA